MKIDKYETNNLTIITNDKMLFCQVICILGETLEPFDEDGIIPVYGFGDFKTKDKTIFELKSGVCVSAIFIKF